MMLIIMVDCKVVEKEKDKTVIKNSKKIIYFYLLINRVILGFISQKENINRELTKKKEKKKKGAK